MKIKDINIENNEQNLALCEVLNLSVPELKLNKEKEIPKKTYKKYQKIVKRLENKPIQYILKKANFYGKDYYINKNVLIPRPETEELVQETHNLIKKHLKKENISILDIGTGSGVIALTLKDINPNYDITATDISKKALKVAKKNKKEHKLDIDLIKTDLFFGINKKFDVIISNPPYIPLNAFIEEKVKKNEPNIALYGGYDGLDYYKKIFANVKDILKKDYILAFEIHESLGNNLKILSKKYFPNDKILIKQDNNSLDRYLYIISGDNSEKYKNI